MIKKLTYGMAAAGFATILSVGAANALLIDDFSTGLSGAIANSDGDPNTNFLAVVGIFVSGGSAVFDRSSGGGILGGDRELFLDHTSTDGSVGANIAGGVFSHANSPMATGTSLLRWDGTDGDTDGLDYNLGGAGLGVDLTEGGTKEDILLLVPFADLSNGFITLTLYTDATHFSTVNVVLPTGASLHRLSLADIAAAPSGSLGGVDLLTVRAIELFADGPAGFDLSVDFIESVPPLPVPEPASLTLLGAGIVGLGAIRRRRKAT